MNTAPVTGDYANEPAGFSQWTDQPHDALESLGWTVKNGEEGDVDIVVDSTAPKSCCNVVRHTIPAGSSDGLYGMMWPPLFFNSNKFYVSMWVKLSDNWQGHSSGTSPKLGGTKAYAGANHIQIARGVDDNPLNASMQMQFPDTFPSYPVRCNENNDLGNTCGGAAKLTRGEWFQYEMLLEAGTPGNEDGNLYVWINGQPALQRENTRMLGTKSTSDVFSEWNQLVIWGGIGDLTDEEMFVYYDHVYMSIEP